MRITRTLIVAIACAGVLSLLVGGIVADLLEARLKKPAVQAMALVVNGTTVVHEFTPEGVPAIRYNRLGPEAYPNPVYAAVYALHYYEEWLEARTSQNYLQHYTIFPDECGRREECLERFLGIASWFKESIEIKTHAGVEYGVYEYEFPWEFYQLSPPWVSGMAQGMALQVLVRAWMIERDPEYLRVAALARNGLTIPVSAGGALLVDGDDRYWYEEYAGKGALESRVLNGHAHALIGLWEMGHYTADSASVQLFELGLNGLEARLDNFDLGWWTAYDEIGQVANKKYHEINVELVRQLYAISGRDAFAVYRRWETYDEHFLIREFVLQKPNYLDWMVLLLSAAIVFPVICLLGFMGLAFRRKGVNEGEGGAAA